MKKLLTAILALALCLSAFSPALAAEERDLSLEQDLATRLQALNLFRGVGEGADGKADFALDRAPSRAEALAMLVRALGKGAEGEAHPKTHPFTDVPAWCDGYVSYAYEQGLTAGISDTRFGAEEPASAEMYLTFLLRALGYTEGSNGEFLWSAPWALAAWCGILPPEIDRHAFLRADAVAATCAALYAGVNGSGVLLHEKLESEGVFTAGQFAAAFPSDPFARYRAIDAKLTEAEAQRGLLGRQESVNTYGYTCHIIVTTAEKDGLLTVDALVCTTTADILPDNTVGTHGGGMQPWRVVLDAGTLELRSVQTQTELLDQGVPLEETSSPRLLADREELSTGMIWLCAVQTQRQLESGAVAYRDLTYEETLAEIARSSGYGEIKRLESPDCTVLLYGIYGTPHGSPVSLVLVYKPGSPLGEGTVRSLPLPMEHAWGMTFSSPRELELSGDGKTLSYTYHYDEALTGSASGEGTVLHEAGTYRYTTDLATGETQVVIEKE